MRTKHYLLTLLIGILPLAGFSQGLLSGRVIDSEASSPLPGATVLVGDRGTTTNLSGQFNIRLAPGDYTIQVSYLGFESVEEQITIRDGETSTLEVKLSTSVFEMSGLYVVANLEGQSKALNQQKTAINVKNIVAADQITRFPDPNVAEAVQRIPGVNVDRDEGDGRYVIVRGLSPNYTNISVNGEQIPSPEDGVRYMALDAIPSNQLSSIEVTKAITPDMDGDAIGGSVNLLTRTAESEELQLEVTMAGEGNTNNRAPGGQFAINLSQRLMDGKFGYMINGTYHPSRRGSYKNEMDDWESPTELYTLELRDYQIDRNRVGLSSTFDFKPNLNTKFYLRALYSDLREVEKRRRRSFEFDDEDGVWTLAADMKDRPENQGVLSFNLGGEHNLPKFKLNYEAAYSYARQYTPYDRNVFFEFGDAQVDLGLANPRTPIIEQVRDEDGNVVSYTDNSLYEFDAYETSTTLGTDATMTAKFDLEIPIEIGSAPGNVKFGAKTRFRSKDYQFRSYDEFSYEGDQDLPMTDFVGNYTPLDFGNGDYEFGQLPNVNNFRNFFSANINDFENDPAATLEELTLEEYDATENTYAGYAMADATFGKLTVLGGFRYELTNVDYNYGLWDAENEAADRASADDNYGFFLPMVHLKYAATSNTMLRLAGTMSYARPNFEQLAQGAEFSLGDQEASINNPNLTPVTATNLDLMAEHYLGTVGIISAGMFYKKMNDFIYLRTVNGTFAGVPDVEITQAQNGDEAVLYGFELAWQQNLTFLPGALRGLGIYANYTYTHSEADVLGLAGTDEDETTTIQLPGQADHIGNVAVSYQLKGFNARLAGNFNGDYVEEIDDGTLYSIDQRLQIDFSASQAINQNLRAFVEVINLTNTRRVDYYDRISTPATREFYGAMGRIGIKYNF